MKTIYNEGRVIGLSQYELYVRQLLSTDPNATPLTERQWLAAATTEISSMILKVAAGTPKGYHDYLLPEGSQLCGCSLIHGFLFEGEVTLDESGYWATYVDSYGKLVSNTYLSHPVTPGTSEYVPVVPEPEVMSKELKERCRNFLKIKSGLMFQPGQWKSNVYYTPLLNEVPQPIIADGTHEQILASLNRVTAYNALEPDLSKRGFIRIAVNEDITTDVYIFLHGFVYKPMIEGDVQYVLDGFTRHPENGDFLGPEAFPWACPVMFLVTTNILEATTNDLIISLVE